MQFQVNSACVIEKSIASHLTELAIAVMMATCPNCGDIFKSLIIPPNNGNIKLAHRVTTVVW